MLLAVTKTCSKCKQEKDASCFVKNAQQKSGLNPSCKECDKAVEKAYRDKNKEKLSEWHKQNRLRNQEKVKAMARKSAIKHRVNNNAKKMERYYANPEKSKERYKAEYQMNKHKESYQKRLRNSTLKRLYGITIEDFDSMYIEQGGCCAICGKHQSELNRTLSVDHCHETGKVRGLLCRKCNAGIGHFDDDLGTMRNVIKYLELGGVS